MFYRVLAVTASSSTAVYGGTKSYIRLKMYEI